MHLPPFAMQQYERYLPTAFDGSLSLLEKVNMVIHRIHEVGGITNDMIDRWNEVYEWVMNEGLEHAVVGQLQLWHDDGTLAKIINEEIFQELNELINQALKELEKLEGLTEVVNNAIIEIEKLIDDLGERAINVKSFGAVGDGVTDDLVAFNEAIKTGKPVYIPDGVYRVSGGIRLPSNAFIWGSGIDKAIIRFTDDAPTGDCLVFNDDIQRGNTNINISNLTLDGNAQRISQSFGGTGGSRDSNLTIRASRDVYISNIKSINAGLHGFDITCGGLDYPYLGDGTTALYPSRFVFITDCEASHFGDDGFTTHHSEYLHISNSYAHSPRLRGNQNGFEVDDGSRHVTLTNNTSEGCYGGIEIKAHANAPAPYNISVNGHMSIEDVRSYNFRHIGFHSSTDPDSRTARNIICNSLVSIRPNNRKGFQNEATPRALVISAYNGVVVNGLSAYTDDPGELLESVVAMQFKCRNISLNGIMLNGFAKADNGIYVTGGSQRADNVNIANVTLLNSGDAGISVGGNVESVSITNVNGIFESGNGFALVTCVNSNPQISGVSGQGYGIIVRLAGVEYNEGLTIFNGAFRGASKSSGNIHEDAFLLGTTGSSQATNSKTGILASSSSEANGERSLVASSSLSKTKSTYNTILGALECETTETGNTIFGSSNSRTTGNRSSLFSSYAVEQRGSYKVVGGFGELDASGRPQHSNTKWELDSLNGHIKASGAITGSNVWTDYGEYFETLDGETIDSGYLVTLENGKIRKADYGDNIIGAISETAGVVLGESTWHWKDMYMRNEFGGYIYEDKEVDGVVERVPVLNPEYDENKEYIPRSERDEWCIVGLVGQLYIRIDETVEVNHGVDAVDGVATMGATGIVMEIIQEFDSIKGYGIAKLLLR